MSITDVTRAATIDELMLSDIYWAGRMDEPHFLGRLYKLDALPSTDPRFADASGDIWQHRINNLDWDDDWVFYDSRFGLTHGDDETFLRFLAETIHPRVRSDRSEVERLLEIYNRHLKHDGYEIARASEISGRPVYAAHSLLAVPTSLREIERTNAVLGHDYLSRQITRMQASIDEDPELAIGTAKELIESTCKTILAYHQVKVESRWDVARLMKETAKCLQLTPESVTDDAPAVETIRRILGSLASVVGGTAELRNEYGSGHGKGPRRSGLQPRHARLVVGAASTLATFLFETFELRSS